MLAVLGLDGAALLAGRRAEAQRENAAEPVIWRSATAGTQVARRLLQEVGWVGA